MNLSDICNFNTSSGIAVPDYEEVYKSVKSETCTAFGVTPSSSDFPETPLGRFIEMIAGVVFSALTVAAQNANSFMPEFAAGKWLDNVAKLFGIERKGATHSRVYATMSGTSYTNIPAGSLAATTNGDIFVLESDVLIDNYGTANGWFTATEEGIIPCDANTLTIVNSAVVGWTSINNSAAGTIGQNIESDASLRLRISRTRASGTSSVGAIEHAIDYIDDSQIRSCKVLENGDSNSQTISGVTLNGHTIHVCVDFDNNVDTRQKIAKAILKTKTCGCGYTATGTTISEVVNDSGVDYTVTFCQPGDTNSNVTCVVSSGSYSGDNLRGVLTNSITSYVNSRIIGKSLSAFELSAILTTVAPGISISSLLFGSSSTQNINGNKVAKLNSLTLTIDGSSS